MKGIGYRLELLNQLFDEIQMPNAVYRELISSDKFKQAADIIFQTKYNVGDRKSVILLRRATGLDEGESKAIILSDEINADILLMAELKGRADCWKCKYEEHRPLIRQKFHNKFSGSAIQYGNSYFL